MRFNFNSLNLSCSGGNRFIFELSNRLVDFGHSVTITHAGLPEYSDWFRPVKAEVIECGYSLFDRALVKAGLKKASLQDRLIRLKKAIPICDVNVATYCFTAYPTVESHKGKGYYLVQHYEPLFFSDNKVLAEMAELSYGLPLKKLCVSQWLTEQLGGVNIGNGINLEKFKTYYTGKNHNHTVLGLTVKEEFKQPKLLAGVLRACGKFANVVQPVGVSDRELVKLYNNADCFVCTSSKEGFYYPALEAMACGVPVVSTCCAEYLRDGVNCLLVDSGRVEDFVFAVKQVMYDSSFKTRLIRGGLDTADKYSFNNVVDRFLEATKN